MARKSSINEFDRLVVLKNYGHVSVRIDEMRIARKISKNQLSVLMGVSYSVVKRYCRPDVTGLVDLDFLAKACHIFECDLSDILVYEKE